jgi:Cu(I)/Ag(I) efflux system membrane fusion protein
MNKKLLYGIIALVVIGVAGVLLYPKLFPPKQERKVLYWTDPMLPGDRSDHPGKSPMGMERTPVYADSQPESTSTANDPEESYYTCPMHPSVRSNKPGPCPVCGMAMVKRTKVKESSSTEIANLERVSLSAAQRVIANVSTTKVGRADIDKEISAVGVIDIAEPSQAKVTARFNGRIEKLFVGYSGALVKKGDPLFELHSPDLVSAEQELILAVSAAQKSAALDDEQEKLLTASRERLHIHFGMSHDQITEVERQQTAHETMAFLSPISGTVISKEIQEGDYVNEGTLLYRLADLSRVWVYLDVYERDLRYIHINHPVKLQTEAYPNDFFTGKVTFIDPVINAATRTVRVRSEFANPTGKLKPQMYVKAEIHAPSTNALSIPASSVLYTGKRNIVWVEVKENTFEPRDVTLGTRTEGRIEVVSGIREGDMVVTAGGYLLESESQLQQPVGKSTGGRDHGSGTDSLTIQSKSEKNDKPEKEVRISVDGNYTPNVVHAEHGIPLTLAFERHDDSKCTEEVVLKDFNIRRKLPVHEVTRIRIVPSKSGRYSFVCGEGMVQGTIIVQ